MSRRAAIAGVAGVGLLGSLRARAATGSSLVIRARALAEAHDIPALGFAQIRGGRVIAAEAIGYADRERRIPVTPQTAFLISSVTKVITATALLQLVESAQINLDSPVQPHLDFPLQNPRHPGAITFRHLLMHTSSISDANYDAGGFTKPGDPTVSLLEFLRNYLVPGGKWYTPTGSFAEQPPGAEYSYSNVGFALVGYLAERIGGLPFDRLTDRRIFSPLQMKPCAWSLSQLGQARAATPYSVESGTPRPIAPIGYPDWPAGLLRTSTAALARFIACVANGGRLDGVRILRPSTVTAMFQFRSPPPLPVGPHVGQGLAWARYKSPIAGHDDVIAKTGSDPGSSNLVTIDPRTGAGAAILTNRDPSPEFGRDAFKFAEFLMGR